MTIGTKSSLIHLYHRSDVIGDPEVVIHGSNGGNSIVDHHDNIIIMPLEDVVVEQQHTTDNHHNTNDYNHDNCYNNSEIVASIIIPKHIDDWMISNDVGEKLIVPEFDEDGKSNDCHEYRKKNGWLGYDLIHDRYSPVRILNYYVKYGSGIISDDNDNNMNHNNTNNKNLERGGINTTLTGIVYFTKYCESHQGYCHGGSMCSIMDDIIGWCGFLVTGQCIPWCGYTVQINTKLCKPIVIHSILIIQATIHKIHGRKVYITAKLFTPILSSLSTTTNHHHGRTNNNNQTEGLSMKTNNCINDEKKVIDHQHPNHNIERIHATCEGIFVLNKGIL